MKDKTIIVDLDDTLISTHERQYQCIRDYFINSDKNFIDYNSYVHKRRSEQLSNTALLQRLYPGFNLAGFRAYYLANIENEHYLLFDSLIVEKELLAEISKRNIKLVLLSLRSNYQHSVKQLRQLRIDSFFSEIYFELHDTVTNPKIKRLSQLKEHNDILSFCGDTLSDYEAARLLNITFIQVKTSLYDLPDFENAKQFININQYFLSIL